MFSRSPQLAIAIAFAACARVVGPADGGSDANIGATLVPGCPFDPAARDGGVHAALLVRGGVSLTTVQDDRTARTIFTFGVGLGLTNRQVSLDDVHTRDGFVAAHALLDVPGNVQHEVVLLDRTGAVRWHVVYPQSTDPVLHLGANGALAVDTSEGTLDHLGNWFVDVDGTVRTVHGTTPIAPAAPNGEVPSKRGSPSHHTPADYGWFDPASGLFRPLSHPLEPEDALIGVAPRWIADHLVYRTREGGSLALISESIDHTSRVIPLTSAPGDPYGPQITAASQAGWVVLQRSPDAGHYRANVLTGSIERATPRVTPTASAAAWVGEMRVADDGALLQGSATAQASQLFRSTDLGATWVPFGNALPFPAMPPNDDHSRVMFGIDHRGTTVISGYDVVGFHTEPHPEQLVRLADAIRIDVPAAPLNSETQLSADGLCFVYRDARDPPERLRALEVRTGQTFDLALSPEASGETTVQWMQ